MMVRRWWNVVMVCLMVALILPGEAVSMVRSPANAASAAQSKKAKSKKSKAAKPKQQKTSRTAKRKTAKKKAVSGSTAKSGPRNASQQAPSVPPPARDGSPNPPARDDEVMGTTSDGKTVYAGMRRGHYYLDENGGKVYVDEFVGAKIVGRTADGKMIYENARGARYFYDMNGNKTFLPPERN